MNLIIFTLGFSILLCSNPTQGLTPEELLIIDNLGEDVIRGGEVVGFGLTIVENGETIVAKGFGYRNREKELLANGHSLFDIGSVTKSMTGTLIVKTLSEIFPDLGESVLDIPVTKLAKNYNSLTFSDRVRSESVSFRDLMSHRACLLSTHMPTEFGTEETREQQVYRMRYLKASCDFRSSLAYNNNLIVLAGEVLAHLANSTIEDLFVDFFHSLNMTETTFVDVNGDFEKLDSFAHPYIQSLDGKTIPYSLKLFGTIALGKAAGGILSSPTDMGKYLQFHMTKGRVGDMQVVPEDVIDWMYTNNIISHKYGYRTSPEDITESSEGYGMALQIGELDGWLKISHVGYYFPYHSQLSWLPDKRFGIFLTANGPGALPYILHDAILRMALGKYEGTEKTAAQLKNMQKAPLKLQFETDLRFRETKNIILENERKIKSEFRSDFEHSLNIEDLVGVYGNAVNGDIHITYNSATDSIGFKYGKYGLANLVPSHEEEGVLVFDLHWTTDIVQTVGTYINSVYFSGEGLEFSSELFVKNATLDTFPVIPWNSDSCVPVISDEF